MLELLWKENHFEVAKNKAPAIVKFGELGILEILLEPRQLEPRVVMNCALRALDFFQKDGNNLVPLGSHTTYRMMGCTSNRKVGVGARILTAVIE